jgi:hypothetical protein
VEKFQIDAKGISDQLMATTKALEELLRGKQITSILARVDAAAGNLDRLTGRADKILGEAGLDKTMAEARETSKGRNLQHRQRPGPGHATAGHDGKNPGTHPGIAGHQPKPAAKFRDPGDVASESV